MFMKKSFAIFLSVAILAGCSRNTPPADVVYDHTPTAYHVVKAGESISSISSRYHMNKNELIRLNGLKSPYRLIAGQKLLVVRREASETSSAINTAPTTSGAIETGGVQVQTLAPPPGIEDGSKPAMAADSMDGMKAQDEAKIEESADNRPVPASSGQMLWPIQGKIIKDFTSRGGKRGNDGINIAAAEGTSVVAADNGVVARSGNQLRGFGNFILIKHAQGLMSVYTHLKDVSVKDGDTVQRGQKIGTVGMTGQVKEPQIHFEIRQNKTPIDPKPLLQ